MAKKIGNLVYFALIALLVASLIPLARTANTGLSTVTITGVTFGQISFQLDGVSTPNSDWGVVEVSFTGSIYIQYLNLISNGSWTIQNVPVLSVEGDGVGQTQRFWFPLGVPRGTQVSGITYGIRLTPSTLGAPPTQDTSAPVSGQDYRLHSGGRDVALNTTVPPAAPVVGGAVADPIQHVLQNFPNQPCNEGECAPAAVSNSIQFLNARANLQLDPTQLTIAKMKTATNWADGCWVWHDDSRPAGQRNAWWEDKDAYMSHNLPFTTKNVLAKDIGKIAAWIDAKQDVEMTVGGHTVAVVGMADLGGGRCQVTVKHDTTQGIGGVPHKCETESDVWNSNTGKWEKGTITAAQGISYFVVECPLYSVGGVDIPVDKFGLLAPYIGLASTAMIGAAAAVVYVKRAKRRKEKQ